MTLNDLPADQREAALAFLTAVGDDEYIYGDRLSSWLTVAPTLEEDNVLTSIAQDEMGHARLWFELVTDHRDTTVDDLAIFRAAERRRNSTLVERPYADFADTVVRSLLYDSAEQLLLEAIEDGDHEELAGRASVALDEEIFHREHVDEWLQVFATLETEADRDRVRAAVTSNLEHAGDLFAFPDAELLVDGGVLASPPSDLDARWRSTVLQRLAALPIGLDEDALRDRLDKTGPNGRNREHTDELAAYVDRIQPADIERLEV
jgi:ring-1,2-phenylacetyl-CoA epoxidase subunit PaaC